MIRVFRCEQFIDISPSWWTCMLEYGTPTQQWVQKSRFLVNGLGTFADGSMANADFVGNFMDVTLGIDAVTAKLAVFEDMTDEDIAWMSNDLAEHLSGYPPIGVLPRLVAA